MIETIKEKQLASVEETHAFAANLCGRFREGALLGLSGPLGAGKTEFVRGLCLGLGIEEEVSSPTFVLETIYEGRQALPVRYLHHWDLYRMGPGAEISPVLEYQGVPGHLTVIEWPERVASLRDLLDVHILLDIPGLNNETALHERLITVRER